MTMHRQSLDVVRLIEDFREFVWDMAIQYGSKEQRTKAGELIDRATRCLGYEFKLKEKKNEYSR